MVQLVAHGPDIPDSLMREHEEGRVVFFCGAGISYPARLPDFKGLVNNIYSNLEEEKNDEEQVAFKAKRFDAVIHMLEQRIVGGRLAIRRAVADILKPNLNISGANEMHAALLRLGRRRDNNIRLVTTNFDRLFERVEEKYDQQFNRYAAPMLPIPKDTRWDGLVYLHGLLPEEFDESMLDHLVLTSGDFGLAYLVERWAARFVSELFRNYTVCFVGYSIEDPVLRYMMDALAADKLRGESPREHYAFGGFKSGKKDKQFKAWNSKNVTAILYKIKRRNDHSNLRSTLKKWSEIYRDGISGKEQIVVENAWKLPDQSTPQDDFVGRMLWALSDESGLPMRRFAELENAPPLDWLKYLRPEDYFNQTKLNRVSRWFLIWLSRHLNDPELIHWAVKQDAPTKIELCGFVGRQFQALSNPKPERSQGDSEEVRITAPKGVPSPLIKIVWNMLRSGRLKTASESFDLFQWKQNLKVLGVMSPSLRMELRDLLAPKLRVKKPYPFGDDDVPDGDISELHKEFEFELVLNSKNVLHYVDGDLVSYGQENLALLVTEFQGLLRDALDLLREVKLADEHSDRSYWDRPSINDHWQNRDYKEWVALIKLLRAAWLALREIEPSEATKIALDWFQIPYPIFKRMALFTASHDNCIPASNWVDWLVAGEAWWLWSTETQREVCRLLFLQGKVLSSGDQTRLENAILAGPPRDMFPDVIEAERLKGIVDGAVWLRLVKLQASGLVLGESAGSRLGELAEAYPRWKLNEHEREEFPVWSSGTGDPDDEDDLVYVRTPRDKPAKLVKWLMQHPKNADEWRVKEDWSEVCQVEPKLVLSALTDLGTQEGDWPIERWESALYALSDLENRAVLWAAMAHVLPLIPDDKFKGLLDGTASFLRAVAGLIESHQDVFLSLCEQVLKLAVSMESWTIIVDDEPKDDPVHDALNNPIGQVTEALIFFWFKANPQDNDGLPENIRSIFDLVCDESEDSYRLGRVILASRLIALHRVDRDWTEKNLLPFFNWTRNETEAKSVWEGFLWSPRLYLPLMQKFKPDFLETANHYEQLGRHNREYAAFLTYAALNKIDGYSVADFRKAIEALPEEGLSEVAHTLAQAQESAGEQSDQYWRNRVLPILQKIWPRSKDQRTPGTSRALAELCIAAKDNFPAALKEIVNLLVPLENPGKIAHKLNNSGLCLRYPVEALEFLSVTTESITWSADDLAKCLEPIGEAAPDLEQDHRYKRLSDMARMSST